MQIAASANGLTYADVLAAMEQPMTDTTQVLSDERADNEFSKLCALLPEGVNWSDEITPDVVRHIRSAVLAAQAQQVQAGWVMLGPDGSRFEGETPFKAASHAQKHRVRTDPEEARKFFAAVDQILQESAEENDRLLKEHGTLDCPACGGSGHIGDALSSAPPVEAQPQTDAARDVLAERQRQVSVEGWTPEHDDEHGADDLALAAACYALPDADRNVFPRKDARDVGRFDGEPIWVYDDVLCPHLWPWHGSSWKPKTRRDDLVRAGALILAEIERLDRAAHQPEKAEPTAGAA